jgi:hypothetical protein
MQMSESNGLNVALAQFFYDAWQQYIDQPTEDVETLLKASVLVEEYTLTEKDIEDEIYDGDAGDTVLILSDLGKVACNIAEG